MFLPKQINVFQGPAIGFRCALLGLGIGLMLLGPAMAQEELSYTQYRTLSWGANRLDHITMFEPLNGEPGMFFAVGERFGTVLIFKATGQKVERVWKSNQLSGVPDELLTADLDGDGLDDGLICRTNTGKVYVWALDTYRLLWESLQGDYQTITAFTVANLDADPASEIVLLADNKITYVDGVTFTKDFTSINEYTATMVRCGDVDGDERLEIVLNSGQVVDSVSGGLEWEEQAFFHKIELFDVDGDGIPEVLTEAVDGGPLKVFAISYGTEVRFH